MGLITVPKRQKIWKPQGVPYIDWTDPLTRGLVGFWGMFPYESGGQVVHDLSGNGHHGIFGAGAASPSWVSGPYGSALSFDGGDYINIGTPNWDFPNLTIIAHALTTTAADDQAILGSLSGDNTLLWRHRFGQTRPQIGYGNGVDTDYAGDATFNPTANVWVTMAWTKSGGNFVFYVDGAVNDTDLENDLNAIPTIDMYLGAFNSGGSPANEWVGLIDYIRIYDRALTASEIALLYREPLRFVISERERAMFVNKVSIPPVGAAGIMTTNSGYWGPTF